MECNKRNRNIPYAIFTDWHSKKSCKYLVLQSITFLDPLCFYIFGRFVKTKCHTFLGPIT